MKKKLLPYIITLTLCAGLLSACGSAASPAATETASPSPTNSTEAAPVEVTEAATVTPAYEPVDESVCRAIQSLAQESLGADFAMTYPAPFTDALAGESGEGCTLTTSISGAKFSDLVDVMTTLKNSAAAGWYELPAYQADDSTASAFYRDMALMMIGVNWQPDSSVVCPSDQPISACNLKPEQKIYNIELSVAQYKADFSLDGTWVDAADNFTLNLHQEWKHIYGNHVVVAENGSKIDSLDVSIDGMLHGKTVPVTFQSSFAGDTGTAEITYVDVNTITWKIITPPDGEYYLPQSATLIRK